MTREDIINNFGSCATCRYWVWANKDKTLKTCSGDNGCAITGDKFFCANFEKTK